MSNKKHRGDHGQRADRRTAKKNRGSLPSSATAAKPRRVYLRNPLYILGTIAIILACLAVLVGCEFLGWWDNMLGSVVSVLLGLFTVVCIYDLALLLTACITFGEGQVNLGKDENGSLMVFHATAVAAVEVCGKDGKTLPADTPVYRNAELVFRMESGRANRRKVSRLTQKQLARILAALEAEKKFAENA